jgi:hypothetical protein
MDKSIIDKLLSNTPLALIVIGLFLFVTGAAGGFPSLSLQVPELGWRIALAIMGGIVTAIGGLLLWRERNPPLTTHQPIRMPEQTHQKIPDPITPPTSQNLTVLESITFNYKDSPGLHGWYIGDASEGGPKFNSQLDGYFGRIIEISTEKSYFMDISVSQAAQFGTHLEFAAKYIAGGVVYSKISIKSKNGVAARDVWLAYVLGTNSPEPLGDGMDEWSVYLTPIRTNGTWPIYCVDLRNAVKQTFGKDGWDLNYIKAFRLRGNISLAHITVYS